MKKMNVIAMQEINGGFNWHDFLKGTCQGIAFASVLATGPLSHYLWGTGMACEFI